MNLSILYHTIPYHTFYNIATHTFEVGVGAATRISFAAKVSRVNSFLDQFLGSLAHLIKSSDFELKGPLDNSDTVYCT